MLLHLYRLPIKGDTLAAYDSYQYRQTHCFYASTPEMQKLFGNFPFPKVDVHHFAPWISTSLLLWPDCFCCLYDASTVWPVCCIVQSDLNTMLMDSFLSQEMHPSHLMAWASRTQSIDLIKEDNTRSRVTSSLEDLSDSPFTLAHILHRRTHTSIS